MRDVRRNGAGRGLCGGSGKRVDGVFFGRPTLRRRRILFAGFVARMEDTRLPKCVMFGEMVRGAGCVGGKGKEWMGCFLDDLRAFGINADQWTTAAQDGGE